MRLEAGASGWVARFPCFAGPGEIHLRSCPRRAALELARLGAAEAWRIQDRYSRYREDSWTSFLRTTAGDWVETDEEIERLLDFAETGHQLSGGRFDLTSGVLRRVWAFRPGARPPSRAAVRKLLARVGWERLERDRAGHRLRLPAGMELDFGGIGKEYAVDRSAALLDRAAPGPWLVNFGGDLRAGGADDQSTPWSVGLDDPAETGRAAAGAFDLRQGALATSGDARRFLMHLGRRYGHILDARTGWPPEDAPRSVTVHAPACSQAGLLATVGLLMGGGCEGWLRSLGASHHVLR